MLNICMKQQGSDTAANPIHNIPTQVFFTKGRGTHKDYLTSFELALRDADIADLNLVSVSSILPLIVKLSASRKEENACNWDRRYLQ
jgi:pyruvoyl-dependent arginine decarboxylase (PvlArgDC)